jgi:hypothetical protein
MNPVLSNALAILPAASRILDAGGWFKPCSRATHVIDLMPYQTRGCVLSLGPLVGERFTRDTWLQVDFLAPGLHLPYPDRFFDFTICGHTIEDLVDPSPLLRELRRVSGAGYFETPSRLCEQTVGQRDRMGTEQGHPHHHWILEADPGKHLRLYNKADSLARNAASRVPLRAYEKRKSDPPHGELCQLLWRDHFEFELIRGDTARRRATEFAATLGVRPLDTAMDASVRAARRLRHRLHRPSPVPAEGWWDAMLQMSRPYSTIPLR